MFSLPILVERSIRIEKPLDEVFRFVGDFKNWKYWSPWLCQEPSCPVDIRAAPCAQGHTQSWDGNFIGAGNMTITALKTLEYINYTLYFLKPWKSQSDVSFRFKKKTDGTTLVSWTMETSLPFWLFFLRKVMGAFIGSDYERGLAMLKYHLEIGPVPSQLKVITEPRRQDAFSWVGLHRKCKIEEMPELMSGDFNKLFSLDLEKPKFSFSFYHNYDLLKRKTEYTSAFAYEKRNVKKEEGLKSGEVEAHSAFTVEHKGPYRFLGNAWAAAASLQRTCGRAHKKIPMYEIYVNHPGEVKDEELVTKIIIPLR